MVKILVTTGIRALTLRPSDRVWSARGPPVRWRPWQHQMVKGLGSGRTRGSSRRCTSSSCRPASVSESWQEFFADYRSQAPDRGRRRCRIARRCRAIAAGHGAARRRRPPHRAARRHRAPRRPPRRRRRPPPRRRRAGKPIRGAGAAIAANMERSLDGADGDQLPQRAGQAARGQPQGHQRLPRAHAARRKVSFTHLIGYAIVRAIADAVPAMKQHVRRGRRRQAAPRRNEHVNMGLAVDVDKADGSRTLVVPVLRDADTLDFAGFLAAYEELIRKVKTNKLTVDDFQGANITLTNPGTIGTVQSVPRLMPGQGVIVGVGSIDYPAEFEGADRRNLSSLGVSKVVTITSTYDHRIIQGAESGTVPEAGARAAARRARLLRRHLPRARHAVRGGQVAPRRQPDRPRRGDARTSRWRSPRSIRVHRVRGHLIADLDPLRWKEPHTPARARPGDLRPDDLGPRPRVPHRRRRRRRQDALGDLLGVLRDAYCRTIGVEYMHIQDTDEQRWIQAARSRARTRRAHQGAEAPHPRAAQRGRGVREVPRHQVRRHEALRARGRRVGDPDPRRDPVERRRRRARRRRARHGPPRPAQRAVQHHGQELRGDLHRVRGPRRPDRPCRAPAT